MKESAIDALEKQWAEERLKLEESVLNAGRVLHRKVRELNSWQARAVAAEEAKTWKEIRTAPRDRLIMLAKYPHLGFIECPRKVGGWWEGKWNIFGASWEPTHWQELPEPPDDPKSTP